MQETGNSFLIQGKKRISDFQGQTFFAHGEPNYCEVDIGFDRTKNEAW